ncbi:YggT family protein [Amorphus suaedae]
MLSLIQVLLLAIKLYTWIIIGAAIFSWLYAFNVVNPRNQFIAMIGNTLYRLTEPVLRPIRSILPDLGGIDISPIVLLLLLFFLQQLIVNNLVPLIL